MEFGRLSAQKKITTRLSVQAYGIKSQIHTPPSAHQSPMTGAYKSTKPLTQKNTQQKTQKNQTHHQIHQILDNYQKALNQIQKLRNSNYNLQNRNNQFSQIIQKQKNTIISLSQSCGNHLETQKIIKLQTSLNQKQRIIQRLTNQIDFLKKSKAKNTLDNSFQQVQSLDDNHSMELLEQMLNSLTDECTCLRNQIASQYKQLLYYQQKLATERAQKSLLTDSIELKDKIIQELRKDRQQNLRQSSYALSYSIAGTQRDQQKSRISF